MNYYQFINETLETKLTKPFLKSKITLYHGSNKKLEVINPNNSKSQVNVGTKLSKPRFSTWWCRDPWYPIFFAGEDKFYDLVDEFTNKKIKNYFGYFEYFIFNNEMKKIFMNENIKNLYKKHFNDVLCYLHIVTVDTKDVGRGHNLHAEEFTLDKPVKVDKIETITFKSLYKDIIWIPESEMKLRASSENTYKDLFYNYKPNIMEKIIYYKEPDMYIKRYKYRYLNYKSKNNKNIKNINKEM